MQVDLKKVRQKVETFLQATESKYSHDVLHNMEYQMGIGESGKGSVFGSIFITAVWWPLMFKRQLQQLRLDQKFVLTIESKQEQRKFRQQVFDLIKLLKDKVIFFDHIELTASQISQNMSNEFENYNLNELIYRSVDKISKKALQEGFNVTHVYSKCFGQANKQEARMRENLNEYKQTIRQIRIESKADGTCGVINVSNLIARALNEKTLSEWKFKEETYFDEKFGSGGTNDKVTTKWMEENKHHVFGYPNIVRFPWKTVSNSLGGTLVINVRENYGEEQKMLKGFNVGTMNRQERERDLWEMVTTVEKSMSEKK